MNEKPNEPRDTSFQAGEPSQAGEPRESLEEGWPAEAGMPSQLDRLVETIRTYDRWGLMIGVGVQLLVLFAMIVMGSLKMAAGGF